MKHPLRRAAAACCAALFLAGGGAIAQAPTAPTSSSSTEAAANQAVQYTLPNGMTVIVKPDRRSPTAVHMLWVRVGSMDEVDGTTGVAHVLEHMLFKGTARLAPGEFSRRIAAMGGRENAFTGRDFTGYHQQIPAAKLEEVMRLEADRFANNRWPDEEFRRELEVVKEERRLRIEDSPRSMLYEVISGTVFLTSPYRRPISGWMSDLHSMTAQDAREFYQRWYVPANAALVVAGDVDPAQVLRLAERFYGSVPARAVPVRKPRTEPQQAGMRRVEYKGPAEQSYVALSFKVPQLRSFEPSADSDDALALTVLAAVLDGYSGARLDRALTQGEDRVADSAGAGNGLWGRGPQLFTLDGVPAPGKTPEQVEAALRAEVARVAREGVSEAELQRVKTRWIAAEVYKRDSVFSQARELGTFWAWGLPLDSAERLMERLKAVTAQQVQAVAAKYFVDDQLTVGILRPIPRDPAARPRTPPAGLRH
ncbi:insulinase family protein [Ramlibacter henchirensis]|uniref:Insulinase family protein n=1 Tax=Ramlibacter henchirensis TaxID=204072 RepID=A0A4Z0C7I2_9BURK|nr:pitrilysin family protein [Ramlibacter henchirensis]TFZ06420.1 insulinase family protein [Ramlibacter henchirensis]